MDKNLNDFWSTWRSKFSSNNTTCQIDNILDSHEIANKFLDVFKLACQPNSDQKHCELKGIFYNKFLNYNGHDLDVSFIDEVLMRKCLNQLKTGKAAGLDKLMAEHLLYAHPLTIYHISTLFKAIIRFKFVPDDFGKGVTVPLIKDTLGNKFDSSNYRGVTLSPVISKLFELILMSPLEKYMYSSWNQFGFKAKHSCRHALFALRSVTQFYCNQGYTVNLCALDISKAFDKVDHFQLLNLLIDRQVPKNLISVFHDWFCNSYFCVRWDGFVSAFTRVTAGVRQGGLLSPLLFSIYIDVLVERLRLSKYGCYLFGHFIGCLLFADDIMLVSTSLYSMQRMLRICDQYAIDFDVIFNTKKSCALRVGPRYNKPCVPLILSNSNLNFVNSCVYLGVHITSDRFFKCSFEHLRMKFYRTFNCIFSKSKSANSELITVYLIKMYCLPIILYCLEVLPVSATSINALNNCINQAVFKIFNVSDKTNIQFIRKMIELDDISSLIANRASKFLNSVTTDFVFRDILAYSGV